MEPQGFVEVEYSAAELPALSSGVPLRAAIERSFSSGSALLPVVDEEGRAAGIFDLESVVDRSSGPVADLAAPVMAFVNRHPRRFATTEARAWGEGSGPDGALLVDRDGRYRGMVFRVLPSRHATCPNRVEACFFRMCWEVARTAEYMLAVADQDGVVRLANERMRRFFGLDGARGTPFNIRTAFPPEPFDGTTPLAGHGGPRIHRFADRELLVFGFPLRVGARVRFTAFVVHDLTGLVGRELAALQEDNATLREVLDLTVPGLMLVNTEGIITQVNHSFEEIHHTTRERAVGHHVTEVIENTRMHIVATTGVPEIDEIQLIGDRRFVVSRIPIIRNGKCVGAAGKLTFADGRELHDLARKVESLKKELDQLRRHGPPSRSDVRYGFADIVAVSPASTAAKDAARRAAPQDVTVLLLGESGVGKEIYAQSIHALSTRSKGPFVRVNCSAIQETLFESELFGYAEGAFTGAKRGGKLGKFEQAHRGTIFLDEIGDMPLSVQAKMLRVLQDSEIDKVGSEELRKVDVRVIAATNADLARMVERGTFRRDLYYRLNIIPIHIPPLRDRREDVVELVRVLWDDLKRKHGIYHRKLAPEAVALLERHAWPGNIRELRNVLERALTIVLEDEISEAQLRLIMVGSGGAEDGTFTDCQTMEAAVAQAERRVVGFALARANGNRAQAAKLLGVSRALLYKKMHQHGLG